MEPARSRLQASVFRDVIAASERALAGRWTTYVLSNHDIPRHYDRLGDGRNNDLIARLTATMLLDRKSTRLNSSHANISYAVFCLKKKRYHDDISSFREKYSYDA